MNFDKKQLRNTLLLLLGALIWGTAFVAQSVGSGYVGPYTFLAARSWLACAFLIVLVLLRRGKARKADPGVPFWINGRMLLRGGAFCGIALFAASAAQQIGIGTTSTAKAGFLTALYVVLVPLLGVFFGRRPGVKLGICACISLAGLYLLCLAGHDTLTLTGGTVVIDHGCGVKSYLYGLETVGVERGQSVSAGDPLGTAGTAHNLIYELRIGSKSTDPQTALDGNSGLQFREAE